MRFNLISKKSAKIIGNLAKTVLQQTMLARQRMANSLPMQMPAIAEGAPATDGD